MCSWLRVVLSASANDRFDLELLLRVRSPTVPQFEWDTGTTQFSTSRVEFEYPETPGPHGIRRRAHWVLPEKPCEYSTRVDI